MNGLSDQQAAEVAAIADEVLAEVERMGGSARGMELVQALISNGGAPSDTVATTICHLVSTGRLRIGRTWDLVVTQ